MRDSDSVRAYVISRRAAKSLAPTDEVGALYVSVERTKA